MNVGFDNSGIHSKLAPGGNLLVQRDFDNALVNLFHHRRTELAREPTDGFIIGDRRCA